MAAIYEIQLEVRKPIENAGHSGADYCEILNFIAAVQGHPNEPFPTAEDGVWSVAAERAIQTGEPARIENVFDTNRFALDAAEGKTAGSQTERTNNEDAE